MCDSTSLLLNLQYSNFTDKLQMKLRGEGGIKALLGMVRCRHPDVLAQVARGIANFAKCESRAFTQGDLYAISPPSPLSLTKTHTYISWWLFGF